MTKAVWIYHERQEAALCGQHALNNLVQTNAFSPDSLADIAQQLDQLELNYMADNNEGGINSKEYLERVAEGSHNVDEQGNFSIDVLRVALKNVYGLELPNLGEEGVLKEDTQVTDMEGFICNKSSHWFAIRRINGRYWSLNSTAEQPQVISHFRLDAEIEALRDEGYSVFCVTKNLPLANRDEAEERGSFVPEFWWNESDLVSGATSNNNEKKKEAADPWKDMGSGNRLDGKPTNGSQHMDSNDSAFVENMSEEEMLQMAMAASLQPQERQNSTEEIVLVPNEPPQDAKCSVKIQFRLPSGKRIVRRFLETDKVHVLYAYVKLESPAGNGNTQTLELRSGFPPKDLKALQDESVQSASLSGEMVQCRYV